MKTTKISWKKHTTEQLEAIVANPPYENSHWLEAMKAEIARRNAAR